MSWKVDTEASANFLLLGGGLRPDERRGRPARAGYRGIKPLLHLWALALLVVVIFPRQTWALEAGAAFPPFAGYRFQGNLPQDLNGKILVIDFWASWCAPCKASFPVLSAIQNEFAARGVVVLGISVDEKASAFDQFKKRMNPTFATVRDTDHRLTVDVAVPTMPTTYIVDRNGRVRFVHAGFHDETSQTLHREITQLLEEKS